MKRIAAAVRSDFDANDDGVVLRTIRLSKRIGKRTILNGVDLEVFKGDRIALTGANGSGKTTLLRCLAGETRPTSGEVHWFGQSGASRLVPRQHIGMVAHDSRLYPDLTARENLMFAARMWQVPRAAEKVEEWLQAIGLFQHAHRPPTQLSRGMQQRLAVARALIHDPRIILMDEPFAAMDQERVDWLCRLIRDLSLGNRAIIFATHDSKFTETLATRVIELDGGRLHERDAQNVLTFGRAGITQLVA
jgi:heme ABC exporter ATP-binding subunit CcmA